MVERCHGFRSEVNKHQCFLSWQDAAHDEISFALEYLIPSDLIPDVELRKKIADAMAVHLIRADEVNDLETMKRWDLILKCLASEPHPTLEHAPDKVVRPSFGWRSFLGAIPRTEDAAA